MKSRLEQARRIVVKIGSALLVDAKTGTIKASWLSSLIDDLADQRVKGAEIILVSSGAIASGMARLGLSRRPRSIPEKQAAAAVGQTHNLLDGHFGLMKCWHSSKWSYGIRDRWEWVGITVGVMRLCLLPKRVAGATGSVATRSRIS